jgi:hypothetical protein
MRLAVADVLSSQRNRIGMRTSYCRFGLAGYVLFASGMMPDLEAAF